MGKGSQLCQAPETHSTMAGSRPEAPSPTFASFSFVSMSQFSHDQWLGGQKERLPLKLWAPLMCRFHQGPSWSWANLQLPTLIPPFVNIPRNSSGPLPLSSLRISSFGFLGWLNWWVEWAGQGLPPFFFLAALSLCCLKQAPH